MSSVGSASSPVASLVAAHVGEDGLTIREFAARSVDPQTGYQPSTNTVWKLIHGHPTRVTPELVRAVAVGIGASLDAVQEAFIEQYVTGPRGGCV